MEIPAALTFKYYELISVFFSIFFLFILSVYITAKIWAGVNKKATVHGTAEVCGACAALTEVRRIPEMDKLQKELRASGGVLARLDKTVSELTLTTASLKDDFVSLKSEVTELSRIIQGDWQEQIKRLRDKLNMKDDQIRRLEDKG